MNKKYYKSDKIRDIRTLVKRAARIYSEKVAYRELGPEKQILEYTYSRLNEDVDAFGTKLIEMGMKGNHIAILGENSYKWVVSYLSVINGVGVVVPLDKELTSEDIIKLIIKSEAQTLIASDTFIPHLRNILDNCPVLKDCIVMNSNQDIKQDFPSMEEFIRNGKELLKKGNREYIDCNIDVNAMSEIIFTSGTTGSNKGVMLCHKNIMAVVYGSMSLIDAKGISFSVLPINHAYECSCHILGGIYSGITVCFNDSLKRVVENMKGFKPNMSIMVPLFLESMYKNIWREAEKNRLTEHLKYGIWFSNLLRKFGIDKRQKFFKPILENFGGNLNQIVCGGAPCRPEVIKGLTDVGIDVLNGYGITECAPLVACNSKTWSKEGSIGRIMPNSQVRIEQPNEQGIGEIQVNGDNVMIGYYNDPENTRISFTEDGWFRTGDLGYLDKDNFLFINGREKNLIILANGKNVHPEELEDIIIGKLEYVKEVVVFSPPAENGSDKGIYAYVYIDEEYQLEEGFHHITDKLNHDIKMINRNLPGYKRLSNTIISKSEFEKTTTKKIKRALVPERSALI